MKSDTKFICDSPLLAEHFNVNKVADTFLLNLSIKGNVVAGNEK
jgi:hypothetical protein